MNNSWLRSTTCQIFLIVASLVPQAEAQVHQAKPPLESSVVQSKIEAGWGFVIDGGSIVAVHTTVSERNTFTDIPIPEVHRLSVPTSFINHVDTDLLVTELPLLQELRVTTDFSQQHVLTRAGCLTALRIPNLTSLSVGSLDCLEAESNKNPIRVPDRFKTLSISLAGHEDLYYFSDNSQIEEVKVSTKAGEWIGQTTIEEFHKLSHLRSLHLKNSHLRHRREVDLSPLFELPHLDRIELQNVIINPSQLAHLAHLRILRLCNCRFTSPPEDALFAHPSLERLTLELQSMHDLQIYTPIRKEGRNLRSITLQLPRINDLMLFDDTNADVQIHLGTFSPSLRICYEADQFDQRHFLRNFGVEQAELLANVNKLRSVTISNGDHAGEIVTSDTAIIKLAESTKLKELIVNARYAAAVETTSESSSLVKLRQLTLSLSPSPSIQVLRRLIGPELAELSIDLPEAVTSTDVLASLPDMRKLHTLRLRYLGFGRQSDVIASRLYSPTLRKLRIEDGYIENGEVDRIISKCPDLEVLELMNCDFESVDEILKLNELEHLSDVSVLDCSIPASVVLGLNASVLRIGNREILELGK